MIILWSVLIFLIIMNKNITLGIAEDHLILRQGLISLVKEFGDLKLLFDVGNGKELLEQLKQHKPDVVLLDIEMPVMDGSEALCKIRERYPELKVVVLTNYYQESFIIEFLKKGVSAFLPKNAGIEKIISTIRAVFEEGSFYDNGVASVLTKTMAHAGEVRGDIRRADLNLTRQELNIIRLMCQNKSSSEIAKQLFISVRTVEGHRLHIRQKTNCKNNMDLAAFSIKNNLLSFI